MAQNTPWGLYLLRQFRFLLRSSGDLGVGAAVLGKPERKGRLKVVRGIVGWRTGLFFTQVSSTFLLFSPFPSSTNQEKLPSPQDGGSHRLRTCAPPSIS